VPGEARDHLGRAAHDVDRLALPDNGRHLTRLKLGEIEIDGSAERACAL